MTITQYTQKNPRTEAGLVKGIQVKLIPWIPFENNNSNFRIINKIPEAIEGGLRRLKRDRSEVSLISIDAEKLRSSSEKVADIAKNNGFEALGYFAIKITSPNHPEIDNTAVHYVLMIRDISDGSLHNIPYGNSVGNEGIQGNVDPTEMETLITYFHNYLFARKWRYDAETGNITEDNENGFPFETMGFYFPNHDNYVDSSGNTRIPRTAKFLLEPVDWSLDMLSAVRQRNRGFIVEHFQVIANRALAYVMTPKDLDRDPDKFQRLLEFAAKACYVIQEHEANPGYNQDGNKATVRATPEQREEAKKAVRKYMEQFSTAYRSAIDPTDPAYWVDAANYITPLNLSYPAQQQKIIYARRAAEEAAIKRYRAYVNQSER